MGNFRNPYEYAVCLWDHKSTTTGRGYTLARKYREPFDRKRCKFADRASKYLDLQ